MKDDVSDKTKYFSLLVDEYYYEEALLERDDFLLLYFQHIHLTFCHFTTSQIIFSFIAIAGGNKQK